MKNIDKYFEMAKKPERLTTEDDLKILNSFMSSDRDNSKEVNFDNSNDQSLPMRVIGIGSTVSSDYKIEKQLSSKKKEFIKAALTVQTRRLTLLINASRYGWGNLDVPIYVAIISFFVKTLSL